MRQIWAFDYVFASPHRWEFDNGFRPHRRIFDRIFFEKSNSRGFARGGMIAVGIDSYIICADNNYPHWVAIAIYLYYKA